jgi:DNA-nicking Smr family endonuclease
VPDDPRYDDDDDDDDDDAPWDPDAPIEVPITDELDLHTFHPREVKDLVDEYLRAAAEKGFAEVRIVHGKGTGTLRRTVHALLERHPLVAGFRLADARSGAWGATLVSLRRG